MLTEEQLQRRRGYLTASDVSAVLGENPHKTAWDVWVEKTSEVEPSEAGEAAEIGNDLEDAMLNWGARQVGIDPASIERQVWFVSPRGVIAATMDGVARRGGKRIIDPTTGFEAKTTSIDGEQWGEAGTDLVPFKVLFQCAAQMIACPTLQRVHVPALLAGFRLERRLYTIHRDDELLESVESRCREWWQRYVVGREQPPQDAGGPSMDVLKRVKRVPAKSVALPAELVARWRQAEDALKAAADLQEQAKAAVIAALGDAEGGECPLGKVSFMQQTRKGLDAEALKAEQPDVFERYYRPGKPFRVCRFTAARAAKAVA